MQGKLTGVYFTTSVCFKRKTFLLLLHLLLHLLPKVLVQTCEIQSASVTCDVNECRATLIASFTYDNE